MLRPLLLLASACAARAVPLSSTLLTLRDDVDALEAIIGADHERRRPESCEERMAGDHYEATNPRTSEKESLWTSLATRCETCVRNDGACQLCVKLSSWGDMKCLGKDSAGCDTSEGYALLADPDCHEVSLQMRLMDMVSDQRMAAWMHAAGVPSPSTKLDDYAFAFLDVRTLGVGVARRRRSGEREGSGAACAWAGGDARGAVGHILVTSWLRVGRSMACSTGWMQRTRGISAILTTPRRTGRAIRWSNWS